MSTPHSVAHYLGGFFQLAYVTNDLDRALRQMRERHGMTKFHLSESTRFDELYYRGQPAGMEARIALGFTGPVNIEVIQPLSGAADIYAASLDKATPANQLQVVLHHVGVRVDDVEAALRHLGSLGYPPALNGRINGFVDFAYFDLRAELGHYLELIRFHEAGQAFWRQIEQEYRLAG